jgi:PAS domain S-box-containing protein
VTILHPDGHVILTHDVDTDASLRLTADYTLFAPIRFDSAGGSLRAPLRVAGETYVTGFRSLSNPPLSLAVSLKQSSVLADWRREVLNSVTVLSVVGALMLIAGFLVNREIRARAASDAALRENRARFHEIMYNAPVLVSVKDVDGKIIFMNKALETLLGTSQADAAGKTLHQFTPSAPANLIGSLDREVAATGKALQRELSYPSEDGTRTALFVKFPLFDRHGKVEAVASFSTDMTAQRRAETWFRTIVDNAPALIVVKDLQGRFIFVNRAIESIVGMKADDVLGRTGHDLFPADYAELHDRYDRDVINGRRPIQREIIAPYPHGLRTQLFVKFPMFDASGAVEAIGSISTDITGQKQVEAQLAHAQRMEAVGQLTGGIAHDFNNLLTVIIGNSEILMAELRANDRLRPLVQVTLDAAERSATLTQRLLAFGRRQMLEPKPTDVNALVRDMDDLITRAAGERIRIQYRLADDLWHAVIDPVQLETAILNLVVNSRDAMPKGGRIAIETTNAELDEPYVRLNPDARPGEYVAISVTDTGTGMPPEVVARAFEPFFTTKEVGKGTGLGLPTIYGFLKQSCGHVKIYSEVGHGTVVRLYVPRADAPTLVPQLPAGDREQLPRGGESILLVEDDKLVRAHTESQLVELGYRVTTAGNADEAFKLARLTGKPDLLLTDVIMPGGANGRELAARMREVWPDLKVLCTSGYTDGALPGLTGREDEALHFLAKPFRRQDLALKVREAIDTPVPAKSREKV